MGFSLTHLSGTGIPELGDFLFIPQVGEPKLVAGSKEHPESGYRARYRHADESASAGYYKVKLFEPQRHRGADRRGTGRDDALHVSRQRPRQHHDRPAALLRAANASSSSGRTCGWRTSRRSRAFILINGWGKERYLYFAARYSRPFDRFRIISDGKEVKYDSYKNYRFRSRREAAGTNLQFLAEYKTAAGEAILVKAAVSAVSAANALQNLDAEIPPKDWDFARIVRETREKWDRELGRIEIEGSPRREGDLLHGDVPPLPGAQPLPGRERGIPGAGLEHPPAPRDSGITRSFRCGTPTARPIRSSP